MPSIEEALRAMLREVVREEVRAALREVLDELRTVPSAHTEVGDASGGGQESLLTVREVAAALRVTEPTVREWVKGGSLRAERIGRAGTRRALRIRRSELARFQASQEQDPRATSQDVEQVATTILAGLRSKRTPR